MAYPAGRCGICFGNPERRKLIDSELARNTPHTHIEAKCKAIGLPVKRETIRKHLRTCVPKHLNLENTVGVSAPALPSPKLSLDNTKDFAALVKAEAIRRLEAGELRVGTKDGLMAQSLIDRREEKRQDREITVILGKLLSGQQSNAPTLVIEGDYSEVIPQLTPGVVTPREFSAKSHRQRPNGQAEAQDLTLSTTGTEQ